MRRAAQAWAAGGAGVVFGFGLAVAQMTDPRKVLAFLDVWGGAWDASLLLVLGAAVTTAAFGFHWVLKRPAPWFANRFDLPAARTLDQPLIVGSALFGIGWGLAGYCPGPAIASLGLGNAEALWFIPAMAAGSWLYRWQRLRPVPGTPMTED